MQEDNLEIVDTRKMTGTGQLHIMKRLRTRLGWRIRTDAIIVMVNENPDPDKKQLILQKSVPGVTVTEFEVVDTRELVKAGKIFITEKIRNRLGWNIKDSLMIMIDKKKRLVVQKIIP